MHDSHSSDLDRGFFRCPVADEDSAAIIQIRRNKIPVKMQDKSIDGFSVLVEPRHVRKLQVGPQWVLTSGGEVTEVWAQWMFNAPDGRVQLGLRRLRDLTPLPKGSWVPAFTSYRKHTGNPELLMAAMVLIGFLVLSLPGIGDSLGTAGKIQSGLQTLCDVIREESSRFW